jgi:tetratricopeptide (TPR) repeat protein
LRDIDRSIESFRSALENDPSLNIDPASRAGRLAAPESIARGLELVKRGLVKDALAAFAMAPKLDPAVNITPLEWLDLCRFGAAWGHAKEVLFACSRVLTFPSFNLAGLDTRGMARALAGDYNGAIEDFEAFIASRSRGGRRRANESSRQLRERQIADRQRWIAELRRRNNPYRSEMIDELKKP